MEDLDQRKEPRVRWKGEVSLRAGDADAVSGTIYDVSTSGIAVVVGSEISAGTPVQFEGTGFTGGGVVRYCYRQGQGYRLGVALEPGAAT